MSRKSSEVIGKVLCSFAFTLVVLAPGAALAAQEGCGDDAHAKFAQAVADGASEEELEAVFGHCRNEVEEPTCPADVNAFSTGRRLASVDQKIKLVTSFNTSYERMNGCGYHPQAEMVGCDVEIRQFGGYGGFPWGTFEHVLFCFDCDRNGSWEFTTRGFVHVTDNVARRAVPPWFHLAYATTFAAPALCTNNDGQQTNVRAILSWAWAPPDCESRPYWGNRIDFTARRDP